MRSPRAPAAPGWAPQPRRAHANRAILPARPLLKPSKITVKAVCDRRTTGNGQDDQVHVHAKTTLTVIFRRFDPAPVGRMARTGLGLPGTAGRCNDRVAGCRPTTDQNPKGPHRAAAGLIFWLRLSRGPHEMNPLVAIRQDVTRGKLPSLRKGIEQFRWLHNNHERCARLPLKATTQTAVPGQEDVAPILYSFQDKGFVPLVVRAPFRQGIEGLHVLDNIFIKLDAPKRSQDVMNLPVPHGPRLFIEAVARVIDLPIRDSHADISHHPELHNRIKRDELIMVAGLDNWRIKFAVFLPH